MKKLKEREERRTNYNEFLDYCQDVLRDRVDYFVKACEENNPLIFISAVGIDIHGTLKQFAGIQGKVLDWSNPKSISDWLNSPYEDEGTEEDNSNED